VQWTSAGTVERAFLHGHLCGLCLWLSIIISHVQGCLQGLPVLPCRCLLLMPRCCVSGDTDLIRAVVCPFCPAATLLLLLLRLLLLRPRVSCRLRCLLHRTWWHQTAQSRSRPSGERQQA
jgi:hypothetical protein